MSQLCNSVRKSEQGIKAGFFFLTSGAVYPVAVKVSG